LVNVLEPAVFAGAEKRYARAGRIPGSVNDPFEALVEVSTNLIRTDRIRIRDHAEPGQSVVVYCGGGIYASGYVAALYESNIENVSVYDGSLSEWSADPSLPLVVDSPPDAITERVDGHSGRCAPSSATARASRA
jgi:thiosulfate/3-mercaptopyruvate sulfurtransferase